MKLALIVFVGILYSASTGAQKSGRIIDGMDIDTIETIPYQVSLNTYDFNGQGFICGGSLLTDQWILTAAHCLKNKAVAIVGVGSKWHSTNAKKFDGHSETLFANSFIIHEDFKPRTNDIALIKLNDKVKLSKKIKTIDLPNCNQRNHTMFDDTEVRVSGWGKISDAENGFNLPLQYADLKVVDQETCKENFHQFLKPQHICTSGKEAKGVCAGDSGGPMAKKINGKPVVIGVADFIDGGGCDLAKPRVFTRTSDFIPWIKSHVSDLKVKTEC